MEPYWVGGWGQGVRSRTKTPYIKIRSTSHVHHCQSIMTTTTTTWSPLCTLSTRLVVAYKREGNAVVTMYIYNDVIRGLTLVVSDMTIHTVNHVRGRWLLL